ncbi:MAG: YibE/F family protein [Candidatus Kaiserbacteria bacterium]|nr:MAG: YibE/F family protein [Candidatus Kaiserbacteria bacterium]
MRFAFATLISLALFSAAPAFAQELVPDTIVTAKARVIEVISREERYVPGTPVQSWYQKIRVEILEGAEAGKEVVVENDYLELLPGEIFYLTHYTSGLDATDYYAVDEPYRLPALGVLFALFVAVVLFFGGKQGLRGLLSLGGSLFFILFLLLPGIVQGYPPVLVSMLVASFIVVLGSYATHGFTKTTSTAVLGMIGTVIITGLLAYVSIALTRLSGFSADETIYLNINSGGSLDVAGLLLSGMLIGTLGVLYDAAIGQSVSVEELASAGSHLSRAEVYRRAVRIGREHIGALVNTLAIAYVGASLPLLLLFYGFGTESIALSLNREIFATELVRAMVGSIGLVLAVPLTTAIAVRFLVKKEEHAT